MVLSVSRAEPEQPCCRSSAPRAACKKLFLQMFLVKSGMESATTVRRSSSVTACSSVSWLTNKEENQTAVRSDSEPKTRLRSDPSSRGGMGRDLLAALVERVDVGEHGAQAGDDERRLVLGPVQTLPPGEGGQRLPARHLLVERVLRLPRQRLHLPPTNRRRVRTPTNSPGERRPDGRPHLVLQLFAPELHHGLPGAFGRPERLESSFVAGLADEQRRLALLPHPLSQLVLHLEKQAKMKQTSLTDPHRSERQPLNSSDPLKGPLIGHTKQKGRQNF